MAPRKPKSEANALLSALKFIQCGQNDEGKGPMFETHCLIANGAAVAFNGVIAAGHPIAEDFIACPHTGRMVAALSKASGLIALTQLDNERIQVAGGKLKVIVPCADVSIYPNVMPDPAIAPCNDAVKEAFKMCAKLVKDSAPRVIEAAIRLRAWTCTATNGHVLFEYNHGVDLPELVIPRMSAVALSKIEKPIVGFGFTAGKSATFWFEDGSWFRTQLFNEEYPNVDSLWRNDLVFNPTPPEMFIAAEALKAHGERVVFSDGVMHTASNMEEAKSHGASYEVPGLPAGLCFNTELLLEAAPYAQFCCFDKDRIFFYGQQQRGIVMGRRR